MEYQEMKLTYFMLVLVFACSQTQNNQSPTKKNDKTDDTRDDTSTTTANDSVDQQSPGSGTEDPNPIDGAIDPCEVNFELTECAALDKATVKCVLNNESANEVVTYELEGGSYCKAVPMAKYKFYQELCEQKTILESESDVICTETENAPELLFNCQSPTIIGFGKTPVFNVVATTVSNAKSQFFEEQKETLTNGKADNEESELEKIQCTQVPIALATLEKVEEFHADTYPDVQIIHKTAEEATFSNGCLDLRETGEICTFAVVEGYEVTLSSNLKAYIYHSNENGTSVRFKEERIIPQ